MRERRWLGDEKGKHCIFVKSFVGKCVDHHLSIALASIEVSLEYLMEYPTKIIESKQLVTTSCCPHFSRTVRTM